MPAAPFYTARAETEPQSALPMKVRFFKSSSALRALPQSQYRH